MDSEQEIPLIDRTLTRMMLTLTYSHHGGNEHTRRAMIMMKILKMIIVVMAHQLHCNVKE